MSPLNFEFDPNIETAWTIPSRLYTDPAFLELEKKRIFHRTWQLVGTSSAVAAPGSYFTTEIAGEPVLVCRDDRGELRAFFNVCRHRAGAVAEGAGCRKTFQCSYHGWTYTLDGRLIGTPDVDGMEFFDRSTMGLVPVRVEAWEQFVFVNLHPEAPPLASFLEDIPAQVRAMRLPSLERIERREYVIACNWKVYVDNYLEGYHIPIAHPGLMKEIDYANYRVETHRYYSRQFAPVRAAVAGAPGRVYAAAGGTEALFLWVFPSLMLNVYPNNIQTNVIVPLAHDRTLAIFEWFASAEPAASRNEIMRAIEFAEQVQKEDIHLCETVQKGLNSASYDRGRYSVKRENGVHHFHALLQEFVSEKI